VAQLVVRQLEETIVRKLRQRAAKAGVSMEEEHRRILRAALHGAREARDFKEHLLAIPEGKEDDLFERRRTTRRRQRAL
jgi:plasmid stability protein